MKTPLRREAILSGTWYPASRAEIEEYIPKGKTKTKVIGAICPHAGWIYSGKTAGELYSQIEAQDLFIVIGPNHRGAGAPLSIYPYGSWETPLGDIQIHEAFTNKLINNYPAIKSDCKAHEVEHSIEVQLPFIKSIAPEAKLAALTMSDYNPTLTKAMGEAIASAIEALKINSFLIIASSDMSHYISKNKAEQLDRLAIDNILKLEPALMEESVKDNNISMCGSGPAAVMLWAARRLGATKSKLIKYTSSAEVTGDNKEVVAYASIIIN